jgi:site-specific DNA recombinase
VQTLAVAYTRVSTDGGDSMERQDHYCREYAEAKGWRVVDTYGDEGISAFDLSAVRPAFEDLLSQVRLRRVGVIVVSRIDRLVRSVVEFEAVLSICGRAKVGIYSVKEGCDTTTRTGVQLARFLAQVAQMESTYKAERLHDKHLWAAQRGRPPRARLWALSGLHDDHRTRG